MRFQFFCLALFLSLSSAVDWNAKFRAVPNVARLKENLAVLTAAPHIAGTEEDWQTVEYVRREMQSSGLQSVAVETHNVLLTYPLGSSVRMTSPMTYDCRIKESQFKEDPYSFDTRISWPFNGYSANGSATGPLVYVNYGRPEDYDALPDKSIVNGSIVIVRYGQLFRGLKVRLAQLHGAVGVIIYSDPADDGFVKGPVYPDGPWRPPFSVQRGSTQFLSICPGDPRTPECGGNVSDHVPSVPVQPLGYGDAQVLLANMGGATAPASFQGGLNFTYTLGGGSNNVVSLSVGSNWTVTPIWNVCGEFPGSSNSSSFVLVGNHRDAWTFGGSDPNSGTTVLLEMIRSMGELASTGWKPDRTIKFCSWDGEEYGLLGSTAHALQNAEILQQHALAYLNTDVAVAGLYWSASATPSLGSIIAKAASQVLDPSTDAPLSDSYTVEPFPAGMLAPLGSGSDYTAYIHHLGIPSLDMGFVSDFSIAPYHSAFDNFEWMNKFGSANGTYDYYVTLTQLLGTIALEISAEKSYFNLTQTSSALESYLVLLEELIANTSVTGVDLSTLKESVSDFKQLVDQGQYSREQSLFLERQFLFSNGLPLRPFYKHLIQAPGLNTGYAPITFPGPTQAVLDGNVTAANEQAENLASVIKAATQYLQT